MKLSYDQEHKLVEGFLLKYGMSNEHTKAISDIITHSDFAGIYSHGLSRFAYYMKQLQAGVMKANPNIRMTQDLNAAVAFDCDSAPGVVCVNRVYDEVYKRARQYGISIGTANNVSNINCGSFYGWKAAADNMIGIFLANSVPAMAPVGGAERLIGTNPIIIAAPAGSEYPVVLDMATSTVAYGKIQSYKREGKEMPLGWANDINGNPVTDPEMAYSAVPFATHKGYGLAVMIDILAAVLSNARWGLNVGYDVGGLANMPPEDLGLTVILIDVEHFMQVDEFKNQVDQYVRMLKDSRKAKGADEIFLPGEIEFRKRKELMETGVEISEALCTEVFDIGVEIGAIKGCKDLGEYINSLI